MMRVFRTLLAALVCAAAAAFVCAAAEADAAVRYQLSMVMLEDSQAFAVTQTVSFENRTGDALKNALFTVYGNVFRRESTLPYDNETLLSAFPDGYAPAGLSFSSVTVNGEPAEWAMQGDNECFLRVACDIGAGETAEFAFTYTLLLSDNHAFLGAGTKDWRLTSFYPALAAWEDGEFALNPVTRAGRCAYSARADYAADIYVPEDYDVASSGEILREDAGNGFDRVRVELKNACGFGVVVSRKFHVREGQAASGVKVRAFGQSRGKLSAARDAAIDALNALEPLLGSYPYDALTIVQAQSVSEMPVGGVLILSESDWANTDTLRARVTALTAQVFLSDVVQVNPGSEAWLIEGASEYLSLLLTEDSEGEAAFAAALDALVRPALQVTIPGGLSVDSFTNRFATQREYEIVTRERGAAVMHELRLLMGRDAFLNGMRLYARENRFVQATYRSFAAALSEAFGRDVTDALIHHLYYTQESLLTRRRGLRTLRRKYFARHPRASTADRRDFFHTRRHSAAVL